MVLMARLSDGVSLISWIHYLNVMFQMVIVCEIYRVIILNVILCLTYAAYVRHMIRI